MKLKEAKKILKRFDRRLLEKTKDCVGTAVLFKNCRYKLTVFLKQKRASHDHLLNLRFNKKAKLVKDKEPAEEGELETDLTVTGEFLPLVGYTSEMRPTHGGISIGHEDISAGTLGCVVYKSGARYILSNNHILADSNAGSVGDDIYQPGPVDGGTVDDKIGELEDYVEISFDNAAGPYNDVDCAICKPTVESDILDHIMDLNGLPSKDVAYDETTEPDDNLYSSVQKTGRTTGKTTGRIIGVTGIIGVNYGTPGIAYYDDQLVTGNMGAGGDSGSVLLTACGKRAVGLLFAGGGGIVVYNRMPLVASELGVTFAPRPRLQYKSSSREIWIAKEDDGEEEDVLAKPMMRCCCECNPTGTDWETTTIISTKYYCVTDKHYWMDPNVLPCECVEANFSGYYTCCVRGDTLQDYLDDVGGMGACAHQLGLCGHQGLYDCSVIVAISEPYDTDEDCEDVCEAPYEPWNNEERFKNNYKVAVMYFEGEQQTIVDEKTFIERRTICSQCPKEDKLICGCAGCKQWQKLILKETKCPNDKWENGIKEII